MVRNVREMGSISPFPTMVQGRFCGPPENNVVAPESSVGSLMIVTYTDLTGNLVVLDLAPDDETEGLPASPTDPVGEAALDLERNF